MRTRTCAWSLVAGLALLATPLHAQRVSAEVVVRGGPVAGRAVERLRQRHGKHWKRHGYREVVVYYIDGRFYDRAGWDRRGYEVVVYERHGRFYTTD